MDQKIKRQINFDKFPILENGEVHTISFEDFKKKSGVYDVVRILKEEYVQIDTSLSKFIHFNLECTDAIAEEKYILAKIEETGFYDHVEEKERQAVLSFDDVYVVKCLSVENFVPYENFDINVFQYSMKHIKNIDQLKEVIWQRYSKSMPKLSREEIESLGVAISTHEIIDCKSFKFFSN